MHCGYIRTAQVVHVRHIIQVADNPISPKQWWSHFTNLMNRNIPHIDTNFESFIDTFIDNLSVDDVISLDYHITPSEVAKAARLLKNGKAPGIDGIRSEMLKVGIDRLASSVSNLFNLILKQGSFPTPWRVSTLTVIKRVIRASLRITEELLYPVFYVNCFA